MVPRADSVVCWVLNGLGGLIDIRTRGAWPSVGPPVTSTVTLAVSTAPRGSVTVTVARYSPAWP